MTPGQWTILLVLAATVTLFVWGRLRHDVVALASLMACVILGLVPGELAFAGFGHPAVITVACVLVLSRGLQDSGAVTLLVKRVLPSGMGQLASLAVLTCLAALLSSFMNNVGALALLMPVCLQIASRYDLPPGRILMPVAFGSILGGMLTMIGTPPNLIVSGFRAGDEGLGEPFGMFDFTPVGAAVAAVGILFIVVVGWRLVPERKRSGAEGFETGGYMTEVEVEEDGEVDGATLAEVGPKLAEADAQVVGMVRHGRRIMAPHPRRIIRAGDILVVEAEPERLPDLVNLLGVRIAEAVKPESEEKSGGGKNKGEGEEGERTAQKRTRVKANSGQNQDRAGADNAAPEERQATRVKVGEPEPNGDLGNGGDKGSGEDERRTAPDFDGEEVVLVEVAVRPQSGVVGRTATDMQLRTLYGINLLALSRKGRRSIKRLRSERIRAGDVLLLQGSAESIAGWTREFGCVPLAERALRLPDRKQAFVASAIMGGSLLAVVAGWLPAAAAFALGVLAVMITRVVPLRSIYHAVDWPVVVLLGALIPVAGAMAETGAADVLASWLVDGLAGGRAVPGLILILVVTMTLSDFMNNAATAAVMCPIALSTAKELGVNADPFLMAVAVGASCAFLTPIGHQNNTLILGPGGFRFGDYWRMGLPLEILVIAVGVPVLLWVWPL